MNEEEKALKSAIEELESIANGAVPPELAIVEAKALLNLIEKQQEEIEELKKPKYLAHFENNKITKMELINDYISKDKIREIISKYIDIQEHLKYTNQELYGEDLKNMINDLLKEN